MRSTINIQVVSGFNFLINRIQLVKAQVVSGFRAKLKKKYFNGTNVRKNSNCFAFGE